MDQAFLWAQIIGIFAMGFGLVGWYTKSPKNMALNFTFCDLFWAAQYFLLAAPAGAFILLMCAARNACAGTFQEKNMKYVIIVFLIGALSSTIYNFQNLYDVLPIMGTTVFSLSLIKRDNRSIIARAGLFSNFCWMSYAIIVLSIPGIIYCIAIAATQIISMYKYEEWVLGKCFKTFPPSFVRSLFVFPNFKTYP
jgi:hypothetical protein